MQAVAISTENADLGWSVVLLLVQIILQATSTYDLGPYLLGPRDDNRQSGNVMAGRFKRALENLLETYPAFVALALALAVTGKTGGIAATGAWVWLIARVVYVPLYAFGVPAVRTLVWCVSIVGLLMMLFRLLF
jgi:uncharacterized MAPEG superfamily protein